MEKTNTGHSRSSSRGSSPGRSPLHYDPSRNSLVGQQIQGFKVNIKPEKKSKLSAVVLKMRGIDQVGIVSHPPPPPLLSFPSFGSLPLSICICFCSLAPDVVFSTLVLMVGRRYTRGLYVVFLEFGADNTLGCHDIVLH